MRRWLPVCAAGGASFDRWQKNRIPPGNSVQPIRSVSDLVHKTLVGGVSAKFRLRVGQKDQRRYKAIGAEAVVYDAGAEFVVVGGGGDACQGEVLVDMELCFVLVEPAHFVFYFVACGVGESLPRPNPPSPIRSGLAFQCADAAMNG